MSEDKFYQFVLDTVKPLIKEDESTEGLGLYNTAMPHGWIGDASPNLDMGDLFNVHQKDILARLNQFVEAVSARSYVNPTTALAKMRDKLTIVGLAVPVVPVKEGVERLPIRQFGGAFNPLTGQYDDLIAEKLGYGLDLAYSVTKSGPQYFINAKIITTNDIHPFVSRIPTVQKESTLYEVTDEELAYAKTLGNRLGVDWADVNLKEFAMGLDVEREHDNVTRGNMTKVAKIALAHLKELPDYYSKLKTIEN